MEGVGHSISVWVVNFIANNPNLFGYALLVFGGAVLTVNAIKWTWPIYATMPKPARFALGMLNPLALNFWHITGKFGVQEPAAPPVDPPKGIGTQ